jgi:hypothetical protein
MCRRRVCLDISEIQVQGGRATLPEVGLPAGWTRWKAGPQAGKSSPQQGGTFRGQVLVDFEVQAIRSRGSAEVPSRANSAA